MGYRPFRFIVFILVIFSVVRIVYAQPAPAFNFLSKNGKLSNVTLLEIGRASKELLQQHFPAAKDGLIFAFLIVSKEKNSGSPTLEELVDFKIENRSYRQFTFESLGVLINPLSIIEDVDDFMRSYRPDLKNQVVIPHDVDASIIITGIAGAAIPSHGDGEVAIQVGWAKKLESFKFKFSLSELMLAQTPLFTATVLAEMKTRRDSLLTQNGEYTKGDGEAALQSDGYAFSLKAPTGWDLYVAKDTTNELRAMAVPQKPTRQTRMFVVVTHKANNSVKTIQGHIEHVIAKQKGKTPGYDEFAAGTVDSSFVKWGNKNTFLKILHNPIKRRILAFIFIDEELVFIDLVLECKQLETFGDDLIKFREFFRSYSFQTTKSNGK